MQVAVVALEQALADSQLPDILVLYDNFDRMFATLKAEFEICATQRVFELEVAVSVFVYKGVNSKSKHRDPLVSTARSCTHISDLIVAIYI